MSKQGLAHLYFLALAPKICSSLLVNQINAFSVFPLNKNPFNLIYSDALVCISLY